MRGLFSKPVAGSTRRCKPQSKWTPTRGLGIKLDTGNSVKQKRTTGTWIKDILILGLAVWIIMDQMAHQWNNGFKAGFQGGWQQGYQQGLQQKPQVWQSGQEPAKITESRLIGAGRSITT